MGTIKMGASPVMLDETLWYRLYLTAPAVCTGTGMAKLMEIVARGSGCTRAVYAGVEGANVSAFLSATTQAPIPIDAVLEKLRTCQQLDWGDFYLVSTSEEQTPWDFNLSKAYPDLIAASTSTVRAFDGNAAEVYTTDGTLASELSETYASSSRVEIEHARLNSFTYGN